MLASTVQFSRYGRKPVPTHPLDEKIPARCRGIALTAVPSGPNSVLGPRAPLTVVPGRKRPVLNLPELVLEPNNQCSTSELAVSSDS